uniref:F-box domain-containing protein n=1 Tax=Lactuca sativa TaxID=4236 RepID=A0A9R1WH61_LACSA|nr:hypothetical protein LSAT_V11C200054800 [Lactuca sativa]
MSEYIPFEIQVDIIKRLPLKSLVRFRSCPLNSSTASTCMVQRCSRQQEKYVSFVDGETFSQQDLAPAVPMLSKFLVDLEIVGSSQGLLCLRGYYEDPGHPRYKFPTEMAVLFRGEQKPNR